MREALGTRPGDHGAIVAAQRNGRPVEVIAAGAAQRAERCGQGLVCSNAPGRDQAACGTIAKGLFITLFIDRHGAGHPVRDRLDNGGFERGADVGTIARVERRERLGLLTDSRLEPGK